MQLSLGNKEVLVKIIRRNNKNIYFRFDDDLNLVVSAHKRVSEKEIIKLINNNEKSLLRLLQKHEEKLKKSQEFWYLGKKYQVIYDETAINVEFDEEIIRCKNAQVLDNFVKKETQEIFEEEVNALKKVIKTPIFTLKLRKMKTRWGVCNYKLKTITLNTELIKYKKDLLRYVIVHEMCHFYYHDHSKNFWDMVRIYYPEYKQARKELRS